ncbi:MULTISPECIES: sulfurtransferase [Rhodococcus]|uniref:sulfurtransferase n=1 Tax=Rhodococcus TaxID=1827 RepID=UPI0002D226EB|nr:MULTISPECIES: sulfurtransferase [Rhodococcus]PND50855.1 sulfurtransferase [Rhodococcus sp. ENV425]WKX00687.1 sulfurtransferase [Rhodococcus aetherivorans]CCW12943.1 Thiosulfate sulfurtransferase, rhodanese [Rhodococcus aetherivorans]
MVANPVLMTVRELADLVEVGRPPVLLDVRWSLDDPNGEDRYHEGHIPGAVYVDLETELADPGSPERGRHPLPDVVRLQDHARRWGIDDGDTVAVYDDTGGLAAARAWWLLRWAGLRDVRLLDGGLSLWTAEGHGLAAGPGEAVKPGSVTLRGGRMSTVGIDEAAEFPSRGTLLDARAAARYRGDEEPVDPRAGHIPGAVSAPATDNLREDGTFRTAEELADRFATVCGDGPVAVYCGSGVTATHQIAALALAGIDAALFPGSWSQWCRDPAREIATGA